MLLYIFIGLIFFLLSLLMFIYSMIFMYFNMKIIMEWNFVGKLCLKFSMFFYFDFMSFMFLSVVLLISSMILFYCITYMDNELNKMMFLYLLVMFVISMMFMIISLNLFSIILGWDMLGLISYLLVIFYQNNYSYNSGMLTFLMNRVGDIMLMMSICLSIFYFSMNYMFIENDYVFMAMFVLFCSITKSAQVPFSLWLPAAMAAPTPVSSLVHSSTLVTAGIYLLIRGNFILLDLFLLTYLFYLSILTMLISSILAVFTYDFKKIIAFSTLSQLGLMFSIYCLNLPNLSFYHLVSHAMFKSLLFMCSGIIIHMMMNFQDIRMFGKLLSLIPFTMVMFHISSFSLCGMYFYSGFYSKDIILESTLMYEMNYWVFLLIYFSTMLTLMYTFRMLYYTMVVEFTFVSFFMIKENTLFMKSMFIIMILSIMGGSVVNYIMFDKLEIMYVILEYWKKMLIFMLYFFCYIFGLISMMLELSSFIIYFVHFFFLMRYYLNLLNIFIMKFMKKYLIKLNDGWIEFIFISMNHYVFHLKFLFKFLMDYFADYILVMFFNFLVMF